MLRPTHFFRQVLSIFKIIKQRRVKGLHLLGNVYTARFLFCLIFLVFYLRFYFFSLSYLQWYLNPPPPPPAGGRHCVVTDAIWLQSGSPPFIRIINSGPGRSDCLPTCKASTALPNTANKRNHCVDARSVHVPSSEQPQRVTTFLHFCSPRK
jgi:hypothetical protein